jgi:acyl-CoA reductase-like NAD-dependent aldehyde dehydrogenase
VKYGVSPGSFTHLTELLGPVLGVLRFEGLDDAIRLVNQTGYGLTSVLHSLDTREHQRWQAGIRAGNLYLNRGTTGAIALRVVGRDRVPGLIRQAAAATGAYLAEEPVSEDGRIELLWYLREQSISCDYHRYGNLGARANVRRRGSL